MNSNTVHMKSAPRLRGLRLTSLWVFALALLAGAVARPSSATNVKILSPLDKLCVDISNYSASTGSAIEMQPCLEKAGQIWEYDSGAESIRSIRNDQCLKTIGTNGSQVTLTSCNGSDSTQNWVLDGNRRFYSATDSSKCLEIEGASTAAGAKVVLNSCGTGTGQKWYPEDIYNGQRRYDPNTGAVYLVDRGLLRHIPEVSTYDNLFVDWSGFVNISGTADFVLGTDVSTDAYLAKEYGKPEVYLVESNLKRHITSAPLFEAYNFDWIEIEPLASDELSSVPAGEPIQ